MYYNCKRDNIYYSTAAWYDNTYKLFSYITLSSRSKALPRIVQVFERDRNVAACRFWNIHQAIVIYSLNVVGLDMRNNRRFLTKIIMLICCPITWPAISEKPWISYILVWLFWEALFSPARHDCTRIRSSKTFWQTIVYMLPRADIQHTCMS